MASEFWCRWKKEYLSTLQPRSKSVAVTRNFKIGDIVMVKDMETTRNNWPLAKAIGVHTDDKQDYVRSVRLQMCTCDLDQERSVKERPANKLILLLECDRH